ncbi:hypothetical protein FACS1894205_1090 [Alphaproteobacteria bacterium]|nr:hypothetical protein FACS1894205_1090 [Alphaproteobacteria bacterium]
MKKANAGKGEAQATEAFFRGFIATGLLLALQDGHGGSNRSKVRLALQGGVALSAATVSAGAITRRAYSAAAVALLVGAVAIIAADRSLTEEKDASHGEA